MQLVDARAAEATSAAASSGSGAFLAPVASLEYVEGAVRSAAPSPGGLVGSVAEFLDAEASSLLLLLGNSSTDEGRLAQLSNATETRAAGLQEAKGNLRASALFGRLQARRRVSTSPCFILSLLILLSLPPFFSLTATLLLPIETLLRRVLLKVLLSSLSRICSSAGSPEPSSAVLAAASHLAETLRGLALTLDISLATAAAARAELCCMPEAVRRGHAMHRQQQQSMTALAAMLVTERRRYKEAAASEVQLPFSIVRAVMA